MLSVYGCWQRDFVSTACCSVCSAMAVLYCSVLEALYCTGCSLSLGYVYRCTPTHLDYKRDLFCLSVEAIESYSLGSSGKQIVSEDKELFNLESRAEIEKSLEQMEDVLKVLQTKLWEVESKYSFTGCQN